MLLITLLLPGFAHAQYFNAKTGDLLLGFRKTGANQGSYELVVNVGSVTNFLALPAGTNVTISKFTPSQLSDAFGDYNNLQWSVSASYYIGAPGSYWNGFQHFTIWFTLPRDNAGTQTSVPSRVSSSAQSGAASKIYSIGNGATLISGNIASTNADNNTLLVREPVNNANDYSVFVEGSDQTQGTYQDQWGYNVENTTPASFSSAVVSDLYQEVPTGYNDPNSGTNNGAAYYVGYFTLNPNGTMTFTRASISAGVAPAPRIISLSRSGNTSTVFFTTTNGSFTYTLYYTNSAGLNAPVTNWPVSSATPIVGNGLTNSLSEVTTASNRFYRIGVH